MKEAIRRNVQDIGVDVVKLSISGEEITEIRSAQDCYFSEEEMAACVDEAHKLGKRVCAHARARDSVTMCVRHGVDVIYHASYIDDDGMALVIMMTFTDTARHGLAGTRTRQEHCRPRHQLAVGNNVRGRCVWLQPAASRKGRIQAGAGHCGGRAERDAPTRHCGATWGVNDFLVMIIPFANRNRDYGFAWTPHGTYARDLEHFVNLLGFTPHESIIAATAGIAALMMRPNELGKIQPGYYADCILVDGDPLEDISILQDHDKLNVIMINGRVHKAGSEDMHVSGVSANVPHMEHVPKGEPARWK